MPVLGELPLVTKTFFSVELFARHFVPERNESLRFMLEEDAHWVAERQRWEFVRGRQERFHLVNASASHRGGRRNGPGFTEKFGSAVSDQAIMALGIEEWSREG